ncbi:MAG: hypothetical protein V2A74_11705, partial [bacterium]
MSGALSLLAFVSFSILLVGQRDLLALPALGVAPVDNRKAYPAYRELIRGAQRNIKIMLYQARFYEDYPGSDSNVLCDELVAAHKRGVHVTAVIDISDWNPENIES